jgi:hypothetical protein
VTIRNWVTFCGFGFALKNGLWIENGQKSCPSKVA